MNEWNPDNRLRLIALLAADALETGPSGPHTDTLARIYILAVQSPEFLEMNKGNFEDVLDRIQEKK